ncbi:hypothetical protein HII36_42850 [Nonomuraea sp. NN258]|uniref:hypothetical protein n=1 Tax=Nonomuraea antri TaxID=2730852 RepID=UPI001569860F|nr:hypothetical protein [Nonomuraea antri]NRQ38519.1 hypothetical protein [Nonomuraea antri]
MSPLPHQVSASSPHLRNVSLKPKDAPLNDAPALTAPADETRSVLPREVRDQDLSLRDAARRNAGGHPLVTILREPDGQGPEPSVLMEG